MSHSRRKSSSSSTKSTPMSLEDRLKSLVELYTKQPNYGTALYWSGHLVSSFRTPEHQVLHAECLLRDGQSQRAAHVLRHWGLDRTDLRACHLAAMALSAAGEPEEALETLDNGAEMMEAAQKEIEEEMEADRKAELKRTLSMVYLMKGKILESLENRGLAAESFKEALRLDVFCSEAFNCLISHQMLTSVEESELMESLCFEEHCQEDATLVSFLYKTKLKKYDKPQDLEVPESLRVGLANNVDVAVNRAERHFYNCDYNQCFALTTRIIKEDPFHSECLPIHISCLIELNLPNQLFTLAHKLVDLFPEWTVAWFGVGTYYLVVGKQDLARRYLSKATQLDKVFGAAWLAYGHSFALENEHDQAMAAYFKALQLMKGCHLPLLYIGVEYGLTNNAKLADKFFMQALDIASEDPFVLHELGVTCFNNHEYKQAESYFTKALRQIRSVQGSVMSPKWESLLNNLGHTSRKLGKHREALAFHQEALVLDPQSATTFAAIGFAYSLLGETVEAVEAFHKALGIRRDDTFSTTMLNNVIEQMINEEPPFPGDADDEGVPLFEAIPGVTKDTTTNTTADDIEMADVSIG